LMVVWGYPCESKSSPAHYSNTPVSKETGVFFYAGNKKILENSAPKNQIRFAQLLCFRDMRILKCKVNLIKQLIFFGC
ncbi:hypothetical protein, partial [Acinetobacter seifertii]|uniref:hypothetical protein n=1 Tax=Acinetobacter seifertii TaxID=1530123 RepID=UPI0032B4B147